MISRTFLLSEFLPAMHGRAKLAIIVAARREVEQAEHASFASPRAPYHKRQGSVEYAERLKQLIWLLEQGTRPIGVAPRVLDMFRPTVDALVQRGELGREVLHLCSEPN